MEILRMENNLDMGELHSPSFDLFSKPDSSYDFDADSGIFDMDFIDTNADPGKFLDPSLCLYPNFEYAFDNNPFLNDIIHNTTTSDLITSDLPTSQVYQGSNTPVAKLPETCQLSSVAPPLGKTQQNTSLSGLQSAPTGSSHQEQSRRDSEYSIWSDATYTSSKSSAVS